MKKILFVSVFLFAFASGVSVASADTHIWDGGGGAGNTNWSTCANWNLTDTCPVAGDSVTFSSAFPNGSTIDAGFGGTISAITISAAGTITQSRSLIVNGAYAQSAGTFQGGSDSLTFNSTFTLNAGSTFISTSGTATFAGGFTIAQGAGTNAWQHNSGTVAFIGAVATINVDSTNVEADETFNNFTINKNEGVNLNGTAGETLIIAGTLTLTNGQWNTAGAIIDPNGTAISIDAGFDGGTGVILINGADALSIASGVGVWPGLTINNAGATINFTGSSLTTFEGEITLTNGTFNQDSAPLYFNAEFIQSGGIFQGGTADLEFHTSSSSLTLNIGATFISTSGTAIFYHDFTIAEGAGTNAFQHNNGTVVFSGGDTGHVINVDSTNAEADETFNNFTINKDDGVNLSGTAGETLIIAGTLTLTNGQWNTAGAIIDPNGTNISMGAGFDGGTGVIALKDAVTLSIASGVGIWPGITINNASGTVEFTGSSSTTFEGIFTLTNGIFNSNANGTVVFKDNFTHAAAGTFNHNNGTVQFGGGNATINVPTSENFYNVDIYKNNGANFSGSVDDTLTVLNNLMLSDGQMGTNATFEVKGDLSLLTAWDGIGAIPNSMTINGTDIQTISIASAPSDTWHSPAQTFTINNSLATFTGTGIDTTLRFWDFNLQAGTVDMTGYNFLCTNDDGSQGSFTMSGGSFAIGSGTITIQENFTLSGGVFNASSTTTTIAKAFTHTAGGTFNNNNGTVVAGLIAASTWDFNTSETFYNFTVSAPSTTRLLTIASGDTLITTHTLTLSNGSVGTGTLEAQGKRRKGM